MAITASIAAYWSKRMQVIHHIKDVYRAIASFEERETMKYGDTLHKPYRTKLVAQAYTRGSDVTLSTLTSTDETLSVNISRTVSFYIDSLDEIQHSYKVLNEYADDGARLMGNLIDGDVLKEYDNATNKVDDADVNQLTSGDPFTLNVGNIDKMFGIAMRKLDQENIAQDMRFFVLSPQARAVLIERLAGKDSKLGDDVGQNGFIGRYFGFDLYLSNNLAGAARFNFNSTPSNNDTITIAAGNSSGVATAITFTFVTSIGSTAGNVLVNGQSGSATNLAGLINAPGTTDANGVAFTGNNLNDIQTRWEASASGNACVVEVHGGSYLTVTSSNAANTWDRKIQHCLAGRKGATEVVTQLSPKVDIVRDPDRMGHNVHIPALYGIRTFVEGDKMLVDVRLNSNNY